MVRGRISQSCPIHYVANDIGRNKLLYIFRRATLVYFFYYVLEFLEVLIANCIWKSSIKMNIPVYGRLVSVGTVERRLFGFE
jgi:hypothetical protein